MQQPSYGRNSVLKWAESRPKLDCAWGPEINERWNIAQRPFDRNPGTARCGSRVRLLPKAWCHAMSRPCITARPVGRLLRPLQRAPFLYRIFGHSGSHPNALPRRHAPLQFKGTLLVFSKRDRICCSMKELAHFPCRQSFIGYVSPTAHPPPFHGAAN
jgi:hypothetical protein